MPADRLIRLYSSNHRQYPLGDADIAEDTPWFRALFCTGQAIVANDDAAIQSWLPNFVEYAEMRYGALLNLPIIVSGEVVGIVNLMAARGHFDGNAVEQIGEHLPLAALAVFAHDAGRRRIGLGSNRG